MKRKLSAGLLSAMLPIFINDTSSTTGGGLAGLTSATAGLVAEYRRQGQSAWTAITLVAGTLGTYVNSGGAGTGGGFVADGALAGAYEVCVPDAAVAAGARWVAIRLRGATNMLPVLVEIELDAVQYQDAVRFGLTALPNAAANAAGGLPISAAGSLDLDEQNADIEAIQTTIGAGGAGLTALGDARLANLDVASSTLASAANMAEANADLDELVTTVATLPTAAQVRAEIDSNSTQLALILQMTGQNSGVRNQAYDSSSNLISADLCTYDSPAHATLNDGATGLLHKWTLTVAYAAGRQSGQSLAQVS